jgi:hypothetical protein
MIALLATAFATDQDFDNHGSVHVQVMRSVYGSSGTGE